MASTSDMSPVMAKIIDFGTSVQSNIAVGRCVDNPMWLATEVMLDQPYTEKSDVFSYGVMLWEIATQRRPYDEFHAEFTSVLEDYILAGARPTVPQENCPPAWAVIMSECWSADPAARPTAAQVLAHVNVT